MRTGAGATTAGTAVAVLVLAACAGTPSAKGRRALDDGRPDLAVAHFEAAARAAPDEPERWRELGDAAIRAGLGETARRAYRRVAALVPGDVDARLGVGFGWELDRRYDEAEASFRQATALDPEAPRPPRVLGARLLRWGEADRAIPPLRRAIQLDPGHAPTWNALGLALAQSGQDAAALEVFEGGLARHPDARPLHLGRAALLVRAGRHRDALAAYEAVVGRWPRDAAAHVARGILLHELGRPGDAEMAFRRAVAVARDPRPYRRRLDRYRALRAGAGADDDGASARSDEDDDDEASPRGPGATP